jgi:hypothetical protein
MFQQLNELKYKAETDKNYILYFLKFWKSEDKKNDYIVKYQIRGPDHDFYWYGRISKDRFVADTKMTAKQMKSLAKEELENQISEHLKKLTIYVIKKGLDKGVEEPNIEFVFYNKPPILKRIWQE